MPEPNILRQVQVEALAEPFRMMRSGLSAWLLMRVLTGPAGAALAAPNLWLLGLLLGLRLSTATMRRNHRAGLALAFVVLAVGGLPYGVATYVGRPGSTTVAVFVSMALAALLRGPRGWRALRDLEQYGDLGRGS